MAEERGDPNGHVSLSSHILALTRIVAPIEDGSWPLLVGGSLQREATRKPGRPRIVDVKFLTELASMPMREHCMSKEAEARVEGCEDADHCAA